MEVVTVTIYRDAGPTSASASTATASPDVLASPVIPIIFWFINTIGAIVHGVAFVIFPGIIILGLIVALATAITFLPPMPRTKSADTKPSESPGGSPFDRKLWFAFSSLTMLLVVIASGLFLNLPPAAWLEVPEFAELHKRSDQQKVEAAVAVVITRSMAWMVLPGAYVGIKILSRKRRAEADQGTVGDDEGQTTCTEDIESEDGESAEGKEIHARSHSAVGAAGAAQC